MAWGVFLCECEFDGQCVMKWLETGGSGDVFEENVENIVGQRRKQTLGYWVLQMLQDHSSKP